MVYVHTRRGYVNIPEAVIRSSQATRGRRRQLFERYAARRAHLVRYFDTLRRRQSRISRYRRFFSNRNHPIYPVAQGILRYL